jgi:hypothetical protein
MRNVPQLCIRAVENAQRWNEQCVKPPITSRGFQSQPCSSARTALTNYHDRIVLSDNHRERFNRGEVPFYRRTVLGSYR